MKKYLLALLIWGMCSCPVSAETRWQIAPGRSSVNFKVKHLFFLKVEGRFKEFEGEVISLNDGFADAMMKARIKAQSIYTGNRDRDKDLLSENFFYVNKFPEIEFASTSVVKLDEEHCYKILGELTMRGITRPIELYAKCVKMGELANGKTRVDFVITGTLNRFDYDLHWNELMETGKAVVGENVDITLNLALLNG